MYNKIFITNLASFYKVNLFNKINKEKRILVVFTMKREKTRNEDFYSENYQFDVCFLKGNFLNRLKTLWQILKDNISIEVVLGGWDSIESWFVLFIRPKINNSCIVESSVYESEQSGIKGLFKKNFLKKINKVYVPGKANEVLLKKLKFKGEIVQTGGVGVMNFQPQPSYFEKNEVKNFLYVGRLIEVKNLKLLINCFNMLSDLTLDIIGFGEQENELKEIADKNINFLGPIDNVRLAYYYQRSDVFILPSKSESWGLVVEEALNNGLPVIVSNKVGCKDDFVTEQTGLVFDCNDLNDLKKKVEKMTNVSFYNQLRKNISLLDFEERMNMQVSKYL